MQEGEGSLISKMKRISKRCFKEIACVISGPSAESREPESS